MILPLSCFTLGRLQCEFAATRSLDFFFFLSCNLFPTTEVLFHPLEDGIQTYRAKKL